MEEEKRLDHRKTLLIVVSVVLTTVILLAVGFPLYLVAKREAYYAWQDNMMAHGPWAEQATWVSEDETIYFVCRMAENETIATATAYIQKDREWIACTPIWPYGVRTLTFESEEGKTLFTADFALDADGRLQLKNVDNVSPDMDGSAVIKGKCFLLKKTRYETDPGFDERI